MKTGSRAVDPTLQVPLAGWDWEALAYSCAIPASGGIADGWARLSSPEAQVSHCGCIGIGCLRRRTPLPLLGSSQQCKRNTASLRAPELACLPLATLLSGRTRHEERYRYSHLPV